MLDFFSFTSGVSSSYSPPPKIQRPKTVSISGVVRLYKTMGRLVRVRDCGIVCVGEGGVRVLGGGEGQAIVSAAKNKFFGIFLEHLCRI